MTQKQKQKPQRRMKNIYFAPEELTVYLEWKEEFRETKIMEYLPRILIRELKKDISRGRIQ